ncbi:hypothetical protein DRP53_09490, partial [candidate division WOR-3 bacterium]
MRLIFSVTLFTSMLFGGWAVFDHDTGNCILSVCANGAIGFWDSNQSQGLGFWYPKWVNPTLFFGSMVCGNSTRYVVDSYYGPRGSQGWVDDRDWEPIEDSLNYHYPPEFNLQEVDCKYVDSGSTNANPLGLECFQYSVANPDPNYDDFVIIEYIYQNGGNSPINQLYSGIFIDFDIPEYRYNYVKTDSQLRTVYTMKSSTVDNPTVGIVYLGCEPQGMLPLANLAPVPHYDYAQTGFLDSFKYYWLNRTYQKAESDSEGDWSVMISAGPFDLDVGAKQHVTFAIVGGTSEDEYRSHCQQAIAFYEANWPRIVSGRSTPNRGVWLTTTMIQNRISIGYSLSKREKVKISLLDISGRRVAILFEGRLDGKGQLSLPIDHPAGIY